MNKKELKEALDELKVEYSEDATNNTLRELLEEAQEAQKAQEIKELNEADEIEETEEAKEKAKKSPSLTVTGEVTMAKCPEGKLTLEKDVYRLYNENGQLMQVDKDSKMMNKLYAQFTAKVRSSKQPNFVKMLTS